MKSKVIIEKVPFYDWGDFPNFVHNRFDLFDLENSTIYSCSKGELSGHVVVHRMGDTAELSLWLNPISEELVNELIKFLFKNDRELNLIKYKNYYFSVGKAEERNHFRIKLPSTVEELDSRLSSKGRYNIRREKRILEKTFGSYSVSIYSIDEAPDEVLSEYYELKKITHHINYKISPREFMKQQKVSHIYVLRLGESNKVAAMVLSCEQCPIVYIENLTYDTSYSKYSLGQILYDIYLKKLIEKGKQEIFLLGGDYEYKRRYSSEEETTYYGYIYRSKLTKPSLLLKNKLLTIWGSIPFSERQKIKKFLGRK